MRALIIGLALCAALSACGKKGDPSPPGPAADIIYPKTYPTH
jgi:predicted small lipoprotein YifL